MAKEIDDFTDKVNSASTSQILIQDSSSKTTEKLPLRRSGYEDLKPTGEYSQGGSSDPTVKAFESPFFLPAFAGSGTNNTATYRFHFPHDLVSGSDFYFHVHWANNQASPTGVVKWKVTWRYARGYELGAFDTNIVTTLSDATVGAQYDHHISESAAVTSATVGENTQTDGVVMACLERDTTDSNNDDAFLVEFDIHYLSDGTKTIERNESGSGFTKV